LSLSLCLEDRLFKSLEETASTPINNAVAPALDCLLIDITFRY